ncbi:MAG: capsular biosynthesis protein [Muribaculaceae bacterium]|nr:capsular biosynthesis protein [Muribaculaceae bacterium]
MWPFTHKKSLYELGALQGLSDHHSHVLPGVDDGFRTTSDSLAALKAFEQDGVAHLWLTPHIMEDYPNTTSDLRERFGRLCEAYAAEAGDKPVRLHLAAEYMLDTLFARRLADRDLLTLDNDGLLLVETSYFNAPANLYSLLEEIASAGYRPLLAHPERYMYMGPSDYTRLHDMGVRLQFNIVSACGCYGPEVQSRAESLLRKGYYSYAGNDMHSLRSTRMCLERPIKASVARMAIELINQQNNRL